MIDIVTGATLSSQTPMYTGGHTSVIETEKDGAIILSQRQRDMGPHFCHRDREIWGNTSAIETERHGATLLS